MTDADKGGEQAPTPGAKYIRTFTGDMIVARKGGTPDLTPYDEHKKLLAETPLPPPEPVVKASSPIAAVMPKPKPPPPIWDEQVREATLARLHTQMAVDEAAGIHRSTERSRLIGLEEVEEKGSTPLRTYSDDFSKEAKEEGATTFSVLAAEQDAGPHTTGVVVDSPLRKYLYAGGGVTLLIIGGVGAYMGYAAYRAAQAPVVIPSEVSAPIFVEEREEVSGQGASLKEAILRSATRPLSTNSVRFLYSTNATTTRDSIFVTAQISAPNILRRNVIGEGSMVGVLTAGGAQAPFFILAVTSYNETFAGMLSWESTMAEDLEEFFIPPPLPPPPPPLPVATSTATSTGKSASSTPAQSTTTPAVATPPAPVAGFRDEVIANHDVRVYRDTTGQSRLLYGYWDQQTLLIARNAAAFTELVGRLANSRTRP